MRGSCLCGAVTWATDARPERVLACHCLQCRKQTGHYLVAASRLPREALRVEGEVRWFQASPEARRGFCPTCGSTLLWEPLDAAGLPAGTVSVCLGTADGPTGLRTDLHIFAASKGDYYAIPEGEPQAAEW